MTDLALNFRTKGLALAIALLLSGSMGCAFSDSSASISDSISSPSEWSKSSSESSSDSSGGGGDSKSPQETEKPEAPQQTQTYRDDVIELAYTFGRQGGDIGSLRNRVSELARERGLTNWEVDALTCESIGRGLARAGMSEQEFSEVSKALFGSDRTKVGELRRGYQTGNTSES